MKKYIFFVVVLLLVCACKQNKENTGITLYANKDYTTAFPLLEKECNDKNGEACYLFANIFYMGLSHQKDIIKAGRYYIKSCEIGNGRACYILGKLYSTDLSFNQDIDQAEAYYRKSNKILIKECSSGNAESCLYAGDLYLRSKGVPHDAEKALAFFKKSCEMNYPISCYTVGYLLDTGKYNIMKDENLSTIYLDKACKLGYKQACK